MTYNDKIVVSLSAATIGAAVIFLCMCTGRADGYQTGVIGMGYSTGKELFEGNCKYKKTVLECINCCALYGLGEQEEQVCIDLCIVAHGEETAIKEVRTAANLVDSGDQRDKVKFERSKNLIRAVAKADATRFGRVAKLGRLLVRDLNLGAT